MLRRVFSAHFSWRQSTNWEHSTPECFHNGTDQWKKKTKYWKYSPNILTKSFTESRLQICLDKTLCHISNFERGKIVIYRPDFSTQGIFCCCSEKDSMFSSFRSPMTDPTQVWVFTAPFVETGLTLMPDFFAYGT